MFHEAVPVELLCLDDPPHSAGKVRGSATLEFPFWGAKNQQAQWYLAAFYLHIRLTKQKPCIAEIRMKTHCSFLLPGSLFLPR